MKWLAHRLAVLTGWRFRGVIPPVPKMIVVGAPHTTNWDFILFLAALHHFDLEVHFLGKHTLFRWPFGWVFRKLGGIPVDRSAAGGMVAQVARAFAAADRMILVIAPEGTRRSGRWWKTGFLKIAEITGVPVVMAGVDFPTKTISLSEEIEFDGDLTAFMDRAREFFNDKRGLRPEKETPVRLREELEQS